MHIHLVIPAYQESERLPAYLAKLLPAIQSSGLSITVQIIDDGSGIREQKQLETQIQPLAEQFSCLHPTVFLEHNLGKGGAVYSGWKQAPTCDVLGFVDADGSIPPYEVIRLARAASADSGTAIFGSRVLMLGKQVTRSTSRHYIGRVFATLACTLLNQSVYDSQCGIKLIPASTFGQISDQCHEYGFAFDWELILNLMHADCPIMEVPIDWQDTEGSKVSLFSDSVKMFLTLIRLRERFITPSS